MDDRGETHRAPRWRCAVGLFALLVYLFVARSSVARAQVELPRGDPTERFSFTAQRASKWADGPYDVWLLQGDVALQQGTAIARSQEGVLWIRRGTDPNVQLNMVIAYLEGNVNIHYQRAGYPYQLTDRAWLGEFFSAQPIEARAPPPGPEPPVKPPVFANALARRDPISPQAVVRTQFDLPTPSTAPAVPPATVVPAPLGAPVVGSARRIRAFPRSSVPLQVRFEPNPNDPTGQEQIVTVPTGINLIVDGLPQVGQIDVSTDRMVIWTQGVGLNAGGETTQDPNTPLELYMEGNIVFRQGDRVVHADRMYYDVRRQSGVILGVDLLTPLPGFQGMSRMRAELVRQLDQDRFLAQSAFITTSRLGAPRYRLQAENVLFEDVQQTDFNFINQPLPLDPSQPQPQPQLKHQQLVTAQNNYVYLGSVPVAYWPVFSADMNDPSYFLRGIRFKNDQILGTQVYTDWDMFQLLGIRNKPQGVDLIGSFDYLSLRGFAAGATLDYRREELFGQRGAPTGFADFWGLKENGLDRLGSDRYNLDPEATYRYRAQGRHRQTVFDDWELTAEYGAISDRNFLEQYFRREWDQDKDQTTGLQLKKIWDNQSLGITADVRLNKFFTQTERLPQVDHYLLGQSLLFDALTYNEHTSIGYDRLRVGSIPLDPYQASITQLRPWEVTAQGEVLTTRHELDLPFAAGPFKFVPFVLGEYGHWGQDVNNQSLDRLYGQAGVRASLPFWTVNPYTESELFNVHGIAHKVMLDAEYAYSTTNRSMSLLPLYNPLDDDAQEAYRRRFVFNTFGGTMPGQFDERSYALRSGLQNWVSSPSPEIADNLSTFRLGARQRWQTKRGPAENRRIIDWITFDTNVTLFTDPDRDNFGQVAGLANYDFRWHVGDRLTLLSNGMYDFFDQGLNYTSVGVNLTRPPRVGAYLGFSTINGPVQFNSLLAQMSYRLSPKWIAAALALVDVNKQGIIGNQLSLTRVGESFLTNFAFSYDRYRQNVSLNFTLEPRFLTRTRFGNVGGVPLPPAGLYGLE